MGNRSEIEPGKRFGKIRNAAGRLVLASLPIIGGPVLGESHTFAQSDPPPLHKASNICADLPASAWEQNPVVELLTIPSISVDRANVRYTKSTNCLYPEYRGISRIGNLLMGEDDDRGMVFRGVSLSSSPVSYLQKQGLQIGAEVRLIPYLQKKDLQGAPHIFTVDSINVVKTLDEFTRVASEIKKNQIGLLTCWQFGIDSYSIIDVATKENPASRSHATNKKDSHTSSRRSSIPPTQTRTNTSLYSVRFIF